MAVRPAMLAWLEVWTDFWSNQILVFFSVWFSIWICSSPLSTESIKFRSISKENGSCSSNWWCPSSLNRLLSWSFGRRKVVVIVIIVIGLVIAHHYLLGWLFRNVELLKALSVEVDAGVEEVRKREAHVEEVEDCKVEWDTDLIDENKRFIALHDWQGCKHKKDTQAVLSWVEDVEGCHSDPVNCVDFELIAHRCVRVIEVADYFV